MEEFEQMIVEEFSYEDFYEDIEAPKFVDLTAPDHRPEGDDRFWFCSRVGCDQKHEEFMDSEAIYQKFVLRVMAARSPNVRLRKALYRKDSSVEPKCPNTVPAKPSRSRISKLAMISSIPQKAKDKVVSKNKKPAVTPSAKVKGQDLSVMTKALTERKKQLRSPAAFRSVQHPRTETIRVSRSRVIAKALVFQSPKKLVKLKRSVELSSSMKKICNGMRKLEIESKTNDLGVNHKVVSSVPSRKPLKGREVKSRVFGSLRSQKQNADKSKGLSALKENVTEKEEPVLENQSLCCTSDSTRSEKPSGDEEFLVENKSGDLSDTLKTNIEENDSAERNDNGLDKAKEDETLESDDKENALALDNNRNVDQASYPSMKKKVFGKKETCKATQKVLRTVDKCFNGKTVLESNRVKYTKPKPTNPKPFRLRTDERGILKEANIEKKQQQQQQQNCVSAKEESVNILESNGENMAPPKHQPVRVEKLKAMKGTSIKPENVESCKRATLKTRKQAPVSQGEGLGRKKRAPKIDAETTKKASKEVATINKSSVCVVGSGEKRSATVPKGPNFHSIHLPKSCTKRVTSEV